MRVAFHLRRRPECGPAVALMLPSRDVAGVLGLCARLGLDPGGRVHDIAGGFLLRLEEPSSRAFPGVVRLRGLAANLLLPVDADLVPALLDDEAEGLTRDRGLIVLPGDRILGFDPRAPLDPAALLVGTARPGRPWRPLPARPPLADRIEEIAVAPPDESPESVLDAGAGTIGTEEPRPDATGPAATLLGGATLGAGRGLAWLGGALGLEGLARLGSRWVGQALELAPRLGEAVLGRQDAALRALLREFREGNLERALRRALPLGEPGGPRGAVPDAGDQLPIHKTTYALGDLLGPPGRGPVATWSGSPDVMAELAREYRKAAQQAVQEGDFRRAAFIYGKLLRDYRAAAQALLRGGLHHDAAVLMLAKLDDRRGAALAFEAAGEFDRAVDLYRALGDHVAAGDLLRRIAEEDAALEEYRIAAEGLALGEGGHLAAGELLLSKVGACDPARAHFAAGWARRPERNAVSCALHLLRLDVEAGNLVAVRGLLAEADPFFARLGDLALAGRFYNELAGLADRGVGEVAAARAELRDRALLGLAHELRARARPGAPAAELVATLSRRPETWPAAVISDADFAIAAATRPPRPLLAPRGDDPGVQWLRAGRGVVTAFCAAEASGEVFLGFEEGEVLVVRPERAEVARVAFYDLAVTALAVAPDGSTLVTLRSSKAGRGVLSTYERAPDGHYRTLLGTVLPVEESVHPALTPLVSHPSGARVGICYGREVHFLSVATLTWAGTFRPVARELFPPVLLLPWPRPDGDEDRFAVFAYDGQAWTLFDAEGDVIEVTGLLWQPSLPVANPLRSVPVSWMYDGPEHLELAGLGADHTLRRAAFQRGEGRLDVLANSTTEAEGGYLAATLVRPRLIAAVTRSQIDWLRGGARKLTPWVTTRVALPSAVACVANRRAGELIVIGADGLIARVPIPG